MLSYGGQSRGKVRMAGALRRIQRVAMRSLSSVTSSSDREGLQLTHSRRMGESTIVALVRPVISSARAASHARVEDAKPPRVDLLDRKAIGGSMKLFPDRCP